MEKKVPKEPTLEAALKEGKMDTSTMQLLINKEILELLRAKKGKNKPEAAEAADDPRQCPNNGSAG